MDFHYNYFKTKYGDNTRVLFTDTDSLAYETKTDFYKDIRSDVEKRFDTSDNPTNHPPSELTLIAERALTGLVGSKQARRYSISTALRCHLPAS